MTEKLLVMQKARKQEIQEVVDGQVESFFDLLR